MEATTTTEVTTPPAEAAPAQETPPSPKVAKLQAMGFENVTSDDEAFERLAAAYEQTKNEFTSKLQQALDQLQVDRTQTQPTNQPAQTQEAQGWWNPPHIDQALVAKYREADGSWKPNTPTDVRQQAEAYQAYFDRWSNDLVFNGGKVLPRIIREEAEKIVAEHLGRTQQQQQLTSFQHQIFSDNPWLFEKNAITGQPNTSKLSAEGELIDQYMQEAQARGADYQLAWELALLKHQSAKASVQQQQAADAKSAADINEQKKREALVRASGLPNRNASLPTPAETRTSQRNRSLSPGQRFVQIAAREGVAIN